MSNCPGAQPAAEAAEILDTAGIPYVAFGWLPIALLAHDCKFGEVEFVVRDKDLVAAREELVEQGFRLCDKPDCLELLDNRYLPPPSDDSDIPWGDQIMTVGEYIALNLLNSHHLIADAHFHLDWQYDKCTILSLYKKSRILRWVPVLEDDSCNDDLSLLWRSDDPSLPEARPNGPCGPWRDLPPVRFLNPASFCEVLFLLYCRDYCHVRGRDFSWRGMWETLIEHRVQHNRPLRPDLKLVWDAAEDFIVRCIHSQDPFPKLSALRRQLIAKGDIQAAEIPEVMEDAMH
ncbi:hypothetical protein BDV18DRAFT_55491 [Aspergillus unguis]